MPIRSPRSLALPAVVLLAGLAAAAHGADSLELTSAQMQSLQLVLAPAAPARAIALTRLPAVVEAPLAGSRTVSAPFAGVVTRILVDEGASVRAGQALARIQSHDYLAARAELARSRSEAELARSQQRRDDALLAEGIIARSRAEHSRARAGDAQARAQQAQAALADVFVPAQAGAGEYELRAPQAARVLHRDIAPGQVVGAFAPAFTLAIDEGVDVLIQAPLDQAAQYAPGQAVVMDDGSRGELVAVGLAGEAGSQSLRLRAHLPQAGRWVVGQRASVRLELPAPAHALRVPAGAVVVDGVSAHVFVASGQRFRAVAVEVLGSDGEASIVRGALQAGEQVVVRGASALQAMHGG